MPISWVPGGHPLGTPLGTDRRKRTPVGLVTQAVSWVIIVDSGAAESTHTGRT